MTRKFLVWMLFAFSDALVPQQQSSSTTSSMPGANTTSVLSATGWANSTFLTSSLSLSKSRASAKASDSSTQTIPLSQPVASGLVSKNEGILADNSAVSFASSSRSSISSSTDVGRVIMQDLGSSITTTASILASSTSTANRSVLPTQPIAVGLVTINGTVYTGNIFR